MCLHGTGDTGKRKRGSSSYYKRRWSPDGHPEPPRPVYYLPTNILTTPFAAPQSMQQVQIQVQPSRQQRAAHLSRPQHRRQQRLRSPRTPPPSYAPLPTNTNPAPRRRTTPSAYSPTPQIASSRRHSASPSVSSSTRQLNPSSPQPPPYDGEMAANEPWRSTTSLASPVYHNHRNQSRMLASTTNLASSLAGQLHAAAESVTNLHVSVENNRGFYERISARLNDVINEIDDEISAEEEYVIGMYEGFLPRCGYP